MPVDACMHKHRTTFLTARPHALLSGLVIFPSTTCIIVISFSHSLHHCTSRNIHLKTKWSVRASAIC